MPATDLVDIGRAGVNGLELAATIDEENAAHYRELIQALFLLLAKAAAGHDSLRTAGDHFSP